jgi:hypothetical protein
MIPEILLAQKKVFEQKQKEGYIRREDSVVIGKEDILLILGPRKSGKTFFGIHQICDDSTSGYLNFEDVPVEKNSDFDQILKLLLVTYPGLQTLIIDEIHYWPDWEIMANRLQRKGYRLILTASNANQLNSKTFLRLSSSHVAVYLFTFSFGETLNLFKKELSDAEKSDQFNHYIRYGGYPEPMVKNLDQNDYILTLFDTIIFRDIIKRYGIRHPSILENLANWLINNTGKPFSLQQLNRHFQISSVHTLKNYLRYLEEVFMVFSISRYTIKEKEIPRTNKKVYCFDNGFITAKSLKSSDSQDTLFENAIAIELYRRCKSTGSEIYFWQDRNIEKVDFMIRKKKAVVQLIQICSDMADEKLFLFRVRSLLKASKKLECKNLLIITRLVEDQKTYSWFGVKETIQFIPAWKWMLR